MRRIIVASVVLTLLVSFRAAAQPPAPPGGKEPLLRLEAGGPTSFVSSVVMTADGKRIYAAGYDQIVRSWSLTATNDWALDPFAFRVPIGPGLRGALSALALSSDGLWLAAAGFGIVDTGFREAGFVVPTVGFPPERYRDIGVVHVWNTKDRSVRVLRGHTGPVAALAFGPSREGKAPLLASAAWDVEFRTFQEVGGVRVWDPSAELPEIGQRVLPYLPAARAGLALWPTGDGAKQVQVAIGWGDEKFRRWDVATDSVDFWPDGKANQPLAVFPDRPKFLTTSYTSNEVTLRVWGHDATELPTGIPVFPRGHTPRAIGLVSSAADGKPDHLAAVLESPPDAMDVVSYQLILIALDGAKIVQTQTLWRMPRAERSLPTLATAAGGKFLVWPGITRTKFTSSRSTSC